MSVRDRRTDGTQCRGCLMEEAQDTRHNAAQTTARQPGAVCSRVQQLNTTYCTHSFIDQENRAKSDRTNKQPRCRSEVALVTLRQLGTELGLSNSTFTFLARDVHVIYTSRAYATMSVSVCLSVCL